ncbi:hypothetical protein FI667_g2797, partial [Globisporangium splendens]
MANVISTLASSGLLFLIAIAVALFGKQREARLQELVDVHCISEALIDDAKFPSLLLKKSINGTSFEKDQARTKAAEPLSRLLRAHKRDAIKAKEGFDLPSQDPIVAALKEGEISDGITALLTEELEPTFSIEDLKAKSNLPNPSTQQIHMLVDLRDQRDEMASTGIPVRVQDNGSTATRMRKFLQIQISSDALPLVGELADFIQEELPVKIGVHQFFLQDWSDGLALKEHQLLPRMFKLENSAPCMNLTHKVLLHVVHPVESSGATEDSFHSFWDGLIHNVLNVVFSRLLWSIASLCPERGRDEYKRLVQSNGTQVNLEPTRVVKIFPDAATLQNAKWHLERVCSVGSFKDTRGRTDASRYPNVIETRDGSGSRFLIDFNDAAQSPQDAPSGRHLSREEHAPEIHNDDQHTTAVDMWSVGRLIQTSGTTVYEDWYDLGRERSAFMEQLMHADPSQRPTVVKAVPFLKECNLASFNVRREEERVFSLRLPTMTVTLTFKRMTTLRKLVTSIILCSPEIEIDAGNQLISHQEPWNRKHTKREYKWISNGMGTITAVPVSERSHTDYIQMQRQANGVLWTVTDWTGDATCQQDVAMIEEE